MGTSSSQRHSQSEEPPKQQIKHMLQDLIRRIRPHWKLVSVAIVAVFLVAMIEFFIPQAVQYTIDVVIPEASISLLVSVFVAVVAGAAFLILFQFIGSFFMARVGQSALYDLRNDLYEHLQQSDVAYFDRTRTGDLMSRMTNDVNMLQQLLSSGLLSLITDIFIFFAISIYMFYVNWQLALFVLLTFPLLFYVTRKFSKRMRKAYGQVQASIGEMNNHLQDTFSGIRLVKSFAAERYEMNKFLKRNEQNRSANVQAAKNFSLFGPLVNAINYLGLAIVIAVGAWQTMAGEMTVGMIATFLLYLRLLQNPIRRVSRLMNTIQQAAAAYDRIQAVLSTKPAIVSKENAPALEITDGEVTFRQVSFSYTNEKRAVHDVNFTLEGGKTTALVGASGSGKTTVTQLISRFYSPDHGDIIIDGTNIKDVDISSLRSQIAVVSQDIFLFNGTIAENIAYGQPDRSFKDIQQAAMIANADGFISEFKDGYEAEIGERGVKLSGGQKQRISIARAILKDPKIILLDEATSALDTASEKAIQSGLSRLLNQRTALVIAHRLSTIQHADHIIVMEDGEVVESGTHEQLLLEKGVYEHLNALQFQHEEVRT
ncbi:ABC transporter ATP-binding protein [Geomicrobium sp. JCM 19039]|uniref:ABC transporter ATP-binding protein n=1 Tax=Geomicrobium sp. JCM 19039 TaxID=1460636 RepID=UPI00045F19C6|nr:ABC transporter ATP-binding protein [Geomicrobium sp. JCM 19039]GAK12043.1 lipid A export ATP-binding/permease protein MsbA [Geomicrobium sp. JCM 19039]